MLGGVVYLRLSAHKLLQVTASGYVYVLRSTPSLVQLFLVYYGLAQFEFIRNGPFWVYLRDPFWCAIIAFSINLSASVSEIMRGGIKAVDRGLHEAGRALGLRPHQRFLHVTLPLVVRLTLPAYGNEMISLLKRTALVSLITMLDVTGVARNIVAQTFAPYEIFIAAALIYLCLTWGIQRGILAAERRTSRYLKR